MIILTGMLTIVGITFAAENSNAIFPYILMGIGGVLFFGLIVVVIALQRDPTIFTLKRNAAVATNSEEYREEANEIYKQRVDEAIQKALGLRERIPITKDMSVIEYTDKIEKDVCMVCKLFLSNKDTILQCPVCESLYHRDHLLEWITTRKKCPVCSQVLFKK